MASPEISKLVPRRAPGVKGRRPLSYPDLNLQSLGRALNLSPAYIGRILNGRFRPSMEVGRRLAALLGWSLDQVDQLYTAQQKTPQKTNTKTKQKVSRPHGKSRNRRRANAVKA